MSIRCLLCPPVLPPPGSLNPGLSLSVCLCVRHFVYLPTCQFLASLYPCLPPVYLSPFTLLCLLVSFSQHHNYSPYFFFFFWITRNPPTPPKALILLLTPRLPVASLFQRKADSRA